MYRLVKVSLNPSGRFGAPATEPGPEGMDELMRISFQEASGVGSDDAASLVAAPARRTRVGTGRLPGPSLD
jgi:hypothetical protein